MLRFRIGRSGRRGNQVHVRVQEWRDMDDAPFSYKIDTKEFILDLGIDNKRTQISGKLEDFEKLVAALREFEQRHEGTYHPSIGGHSFHVKG